MRRFKAGDRVKRSDADDPRSIPAYRDMRGTVTGFDWSYVLVKWDCDPQREPSRYKPEQLAHADGCKRCGRKLAYEGALFCGAACSAQWEAGE